jgi:hypothetical protein
MAEKRQKIIGKTRGESRREKRWSARMRGIAKENRCRNEVKKRARE